MFLTHELFHRYHDQVAGFSDDPGSKQAIWRALWAEGLATYVSAALNLKRSLADALLLPRDLQERAEPRVPGLAATLLAHFDEVDVPSFRDFLLLHPRADEAPGVPARSGYYLGYLVARDLATRHSLSELAHLQTATAKAEVRSALTRLASTPGAAHDSPKSARFGPRGQAALGAGG